jgi:putative DNA primase/helicase
MTWEVKLKDMTKEIEKEIDSEIKEKLRDYPSVIKVLENLQRVAFEQEAGIAAGETVPVTDKCFHAIKKCLGLARRLGFPIGKFEKTGGNMYQYTGKHWEDLSREIAEVLVELCACKTGIARALAGRPKNIRDMYEILVHQSFMPQMIVDITRVSINLQNCVLVIDNILTTKTEKHDWKWGFRYLLPYDYDESAKCLQWMKALKAWGMDDDTIMVLQEYCGYVLIPNQILNLETVLVLLGEGENGKSTFMRILKMIFGEKNCSNKSISDLSNPNSRNALIGKIINVSGEDSQHISAKTLKQLASGEAIEVKKLYSDVFDMENGPRHIFAMNKLPKNIENTHGFLRKWKEVPFSVEISPADKIPNFENILKAELSGILNWIIEGMKRLILQKKFSESAAINNAKAEMIAHINTVATYMKDYDKQEPKTELRLKTLYAAYKESYPSQTGTDNINIDEFRKEVVKLGFDVRMNISKAKIVHAIHI